MKSPQSPLPQAAVHPIPPVFDERATVLILGSFPSRKSREDGFFYAHPQNRFWRVLAAVFEDALPLTETEKRAFLSAHRIALWDVIASCDITGSSDSSIRNAVPNDLRVILSQASIRSIFVNGKTAQRIYRRYQQPLIGREAVYLPSTSPANASHSMAGLIRDWKILRDAGEELSDSL